MTTQVVTSLRATQIAAPGMRRPTHAVPDAARDALPGEDPGLPAVLAAVARRIGMANAPSQAIELALTLDGRIPLESGELALTNAQWAVYTAVREDPSDVTLDGEAEAPLEIGVRRDGRPVLGAPAGDAVAPTRTLALGADARRCAVDEEARLRAERTRDVHQLRAWAGALSPTQRHDILEELHFAAAHGAPLVMLVEDAVFSNFRFVNNLAGKVLAPTSELCVYRQLAERSVIRWTEEELEFVFGTELLRVAGGPPGLEECSGLQITRRALRRYLVDRCADYGIEVGGLGTPAAELACAAELMRARERKRERSQAYRSIDAIFGTKREHYFARRRLDHAEREVLRAWSDLSPFGVDVDDRAGFDELMADWMPDALRAGGETTADGASSLPDLVAGIVDVVGELGDSDIAMSRGVRSLPLLVDAVQREDWDAIVDWEPPNFYCCVLPSATVARTTAPAERGVLVDQLWSIAARMQYNVWHSLPDNLPASPRVRTRDYVYAQRFPDIARWSDQHHRGHVIARVRHAIRAPGAATISGRLFKALVDIRLTRREGPAFAVRELALAFAASRLVARAVEHAAAAIERLGASDLWIDAFDSGWYAQRLAAWEDAAIDPFRQGRNGSAGESSSGRPRPGREVRRR